MRCLLYGSLSLTLACAASPRWEELDLGALPSKKEHPEADAVILFEREHVKFQIAEGKPVADAEVHVRVLVLNEKGRSYGALRAHYTRTFSKVLDARMRVIRPDGSIEELGREKMLDVMAVSSSILYEDSRVLYLAQDTAPVGSVIEYQYTHRTFDPKLFQFAYSFGSFAPILHSEFAVEAPADWEIEHVATKYWQKVDLAPEIEEDGQRKRYRWSLRSIPGFKQEDYAPDSWNRGTIVTARLLSWMQGGEKQTSFASMREFSKWMHELQQGTAEPTPEIEQIVKTVLHDAPNDPKEKARRLYEWVQENIRYVAVEVGMGGWRPHTAKEIFETKYGDCKDKATLLKTFLDVAGIDSHLASLYSHDGYPRKFLLPVLGNSNHAILVIDLPNGERVIADPTERTVPFGALPLRDQEAELLMIRADGADPIVTPGTDAGFNTKRIVMSLTIDDGGNAKGTYNLMTKGDFAWGLKYDMMAKSDGQRMDTARDWLWLRKGTVGSIDYDRGATADHQTMEVSAGGDLSVPQLVASAAGARVLRLNELVGTPGDALREEERTSPVVFRRRERRELHIAIHIPATSRWSSLPEPVKVDSPFGAYSLEYRLEGDVLAVTSAYEQKERIVPVERYGELRKFFDDILAAASRGVVIKAK